MKICDLVIKMAAFLKSLFWKNKNLIYINSTKKIFDHSGIDNQQATKNAQSIFNESKTNKIGFNFVKIHFAKMKFHLYQIQRNINYSPQITYAGYASVPFAVFDGYCLGDNHSYHFFDTTKNENETYKIVFSKKRIEDNKFTILESEEVDLIISSSFKVDRKFAKNGNVYDFDNQIGDKVSAEYLNKVFYFVSDFLDACGKSGVKKVNLYCSSRQPVSFVIGMAIQSHHPEVVAHEFEKNNYSWSLSIQKAKLQKGVPL